VLDFIVEDASPQAHPTGQNILAFDWGVRRLLTFVILNREGEQVAPPTFVDIGSLAGKQARLRRQIDDLKAKKAKLRKRDRARVQAEIDACWRKYNATNEALAHFAANLLLIYALIWGCDTIAGEWLKTLKAKKKKHHHFKKVRTLNWKVNTTVRQLIWTKLEYKTPRYHLKTQQVWPRGSSHECPRCGGPGVTCKSPEHRDKILPYGHWFYCLNPACGFNADRDYVASLNLGRRVLVEDYPSSEKTDVVCQPVSYTGTGAALPFPPPDGNEKLIPAPLLKGQVCLGMLHRLRTTLTGLNQAIAVNPLWLPAPG
jgi:transposase